MAIIIDALKGWHGDDLISEIQRELMDSDLMTFPFDSWAEFSEVIKDFTITIKKNGVNP